MTIDLVNIFDKSCLFRTLEMAFQRIKILKSLFGRGPYLEAGPFGSRVIPRLLIYIYSDFTYSKGWRVRLNCIQFLQKGF